MRKQSKGSGCTSYAQREVCTVQTVFIATHIIQFDRYNVSKFACFKDPHSGMLCQTNIDCRGVMVKTIASLSSQYSSVNLQSRHVVPHRI